MMRIVTRPDFDGIACAVVIAEAEQITEPILWVEPNDMQHGRIDIKKGDIIANLPYHRECSLWFDHHFTNRVSHPVKGAFKIAPSAAGLVYTYYQDRLTRNFDELIRETDKIDAAELSLDEVLHPEKHPYVILSMTIVNHNNQDEAFWNRFVSMLRTSPIEDILEDEEVKARCVAVTEQNAAYKENLLNNTKMIEHVSVTDFRGFDKAPEGNRFLCYSLFTDSIVNLKIRFQRENRKKIRLSVGHSIFNRKCQVNIGLMLSHYNGGGHRGAGACTIDIHDADQIIEEITAILVRNQKND